MFDLKKYNLKKTNSNYNIIFILLFIIFILSYFQIRNYLCNHSYAFISNQCSDLVIDKKSYLELKVNLEKFLEEKNRDGYIKNVSIYFRDLNRGPIMGINENENFSSASLLKLPIVMTVFKMAEDNPEILNYNLVNENKGSDIYQHFVPTELIKENVSYPVIDIIKYALVYSDNTAIKMLYEFINLEGGYENNLNVVFRELGLILPGDLSDRDITTRSYASLFRLLYNSSYLTPEYSEMIMKILSDSNFKSGIRAGVPEDFVVSSKFGERFLENGEKQLHDCGVVYYPKNPYLLCVMTEGDNFDELSTVIKEISEKVYKEVNSRKL